MKAIFIVLTGLLASTLLRAQDNQVPLVGAQVFIEPGQPQEEIEHWFKTLSDLEMPVCRIRMFQDHMQQPDGSYDFSLYDHAFDMADKYGVKIFATLFPSSTSVGGFKFPESEQHLQSIADYIKSIVTHFKDKPAMWVWVLQNEPGAGERPENDFACEKMVEFMRQQPEHTPHNTYQEESLYDEMFLREYTYCYLNWIAHQIRLYDEKHDFHVNNHMLFSLLPEYDFSKWMEYLNTLGASMHPSWHFGYFNRDQYALAVSANAEIIHDAAQPNEFWVTELQGGNNIFSGYNAMNPTAEDIAQWQWTSIGAGAKGVIYWTLNARATAAEAGEWAMLNFQGEPSDRLMKASEIAKTINKESSFFAGANPVTTDITIVYSPESMMTEARQSISENIPNDYAGRKKGAHIKSSLAYYEALQEMGIAADFISMEDYQWDSIYQQPQAVVVANAMAIPDTLVEPLKRFVQNGNKLIVSGLTGFYNEHIHNVMLTGFPLEDLFGGNVKEIKVVKDRFNIKLNDPELTLPAHLWKGTLHPTTGREIGAENGELIAMRNAFGEGEVVWIPSLIGLGAWQNDNAALAQFLKNEFKPQIESAIRFRQHVPGTLMRTLQNGNRILTVMVNSNDKTTSVALTGLGKRKPRVIDGTAEQSGASMGTFKLKPQETLVVMWE